jgi:hypothetical protein
MDLASTALLRQAVAPFVERIANRNQAMEKKMTRRTMRVVLLL